MLTKELNELVTHVGPGTPGGEFLRRYWHPVSLSAEITPGGKPKQVRILGEDLVLFRDDLGRPGLLGLHCSHRCVSLAYGRPEDGGIRCSMHGWLYDVSGRCLEQPAEPEEFTERIQHLAYPCQDLGGLVFAYMGAPDKMPLLPRYETLVRMDGTRQLTYYPIKGGFLQHLEGAWDTVHAEYLHMANWSVKKHELKTLPKPEITFSETDYGLRQVGDKPHPGGETGRAYGYFFMPGGWLRLSGAWQNAQLRTDRTPAVEDIQKFQSWYVPVDDGHTLRYQVSFAALSPDGTPYQWRPDGLLVQPGADQDYGRDFEHVDSINGIDPTTPGTFRAQDTMANETQGLPVLDRTLEHLGAHDEVLTALRMVILKGIADVQRGLDPKHVIREAAPNEVVYVRGDEPMEFFAIDRLALAGSR